MLRYVATLSLLVCAVSFANCGDGASNAEPPQSEAAGTAARPPGLPVFGLAAQDLTFKGIIEGNMGDADTSCSWFRGSATQSGRLQVLLQGMVGDSRHSLRIVVNDYQGPGDYSWDGVAGSGPEVTVEVDSKEKGHATVFVTDPGDGGEVSATITSPNQGRITGLFQCAGIPK